MTITQARRLVRQFARNAKDSTMYADDEVDRAIQIVGNDFNDTTHCLKRTDTFALTANDSTFSLAAISGFRSDRIMDAWIPTKKILSLIDNHELIRGQIENTTTGLPCEMAFNSDTTGEVRPTPDAAYTGKAQWSPPFTIWTPGTKYAAAATATISVGGAVTAITIVSPGGQYLTAPTIAIAAPSGMGGTTATATCTIDSSGQVNAITITSAGSGYAAAPAVTFSGSSIADVPLNLADDIAQQIFTFGATAMLQHTEKENAYAASSWKEYVAYRTRRASAGNRGTKIIRRLRS